MIPNPFSVARLLRGPVELSPDPVEPDPDIPTPLAEPAAVHPKTGPVTQVFRTSAPTTRRPCGHCMHGQEGHGSQYGALVGWHEWRPEAPSPSWLRSDLTRGADG